MSKTIVSLRGVTKQYRIGQTDVQALRGVDLEMQAGELCVIMGPSGSGKTTLLNILGCLDVPTSGHYELCGRPVAAKDFDDLAELRSRELGFVFQSFNLVPVLDVRENIELGLMCADRASSRERRARIAELVELLGLAAVANHRPGQLSGGQQQRVAIARALAGRPQLVLADEPTANLDSETTTSILELLVKLNRSEGTTLLLSTHDPRVLAYARRVVTMRDGRVTEDRRVIQAVA